VASQVLEAGAHSQRIKVAVRVRPLMHSEKGDNDSRVVADVQKSAIYVYPSS
jgi:hypothetical protein